MRVRPFVVALLLPLLVTAATLGAVAWNRSGGRGPIVLSDREVSVSAPTGDNTTATFWLAWQPERRARQVSSRTQLRQGYAALTLKDDMASGSGDVASGFSRKASRLLAVDIDQDADALARRYPDGRTHIISRAMIAVPVDAPLEQGLVVSLEPQRIHVPRQWAGEVATGAFDLELWYGLRHEPWISAIRRRPAP